MSRTRLAPVGIRLLMALSFALLAAGPPTGPKSQADFILDFVSDLKGNIEPCG